MPPSTSNDTVKAKAGFSRLATGASSAIGSPWGFILAASALATWAAFGPHYRYSDTWQLVMNSFTDMFTFLIVFLIQHTQKRDSKAINLKLDEIIRAVSDAHDELIDVEKCSDEELDRIEERYERIRRQVRIRKEQGHHGQAA